MRTPLLIYGAGGFGREVLSLALATEKFEIIGFIDDGMAKGSRVNGVPVLGGMSVLEAFEDMVDIVLAFGDPASKAAVARKLTSTKVRYPVLRHPSVILQDESSIRVEGGTILCAGSILTTDIHVGAHVLINLKCTVGHDTRIGDFSCLMPGVNVAGEVTIGNTVLIGAGANIMNRVTIGDDCKVGMGSVVLRNVRAGSVVVGVPARPIVTSETGQEPRNA